MEKNNPKVSIVIPAYNASNYLAEAIESALAQTYQNIEILVVNDGSKDDGATAKVAKQYEGKIRYFEKENGGSSSALNYGICNMTGEWFSWLSHDDLYYPNKLEEQIKALNSLNLPEDELYKNIFFSAADLVDASCVLIRKADIKREKQLKEYIDSISGNEYLVAEPTRFNFNGCSCLIHKKAFEDVGAFDEGLRLLNDVDMWYRLYVAGYKLNYCAEPLVQGRIHAKQISRSIGFSYHNVEQDMFWNRVYEYLLNLKDHEGWEHLLSLFGKTALSKTRWNEGKKAYDELCKSDPNKRIYYRIQEYCYLIYGYGRDVAKKIYLKLFINN